MYTHPNQGSVIDEAQLRARMQIVAPYTGWVRTFGCTGGLETAGRVAHELGLPIAVGAWLGCDSAANEREIACLIQVAQAGYVDLAIVGSEVLLRGDLSEAQLLAYMQRVKAAVPALPVSTAEVYSVLLARPAVIAASDIVLANYYPYWEGIDVHYAVASLHAQHQRVVAAAAGKLVVVSETGWPSCGETIRRAVPSLANAASYALNFVSWARANAVPYFYFEAFDERWKARYEGPQGACWGMWDADGVPQARDGSDLRRRVRPGQLERPCRARGPGMPAIVFTAVPPYGSFDILVGQVWHVDPFAHLVAVYIQVRGGWWTKPFFNTPLTPIQLDGYWTCDITTGGVDQEATAIAAFLLPGGYTPPLMSGGATLPPALDQHAVAQVTATRTP